MVEALGLDEFQPVGEAAGEPAHPVAHGMGVDAVAAGRERLAQRGEQLFLVRLVGEVGGELRCLLVLGIVAVIARMDWHGGGVADGFGQGMGLHAEGDVPRVDHGAPLVDLRVVLAGGLL